MKTFKSIHIDLENGIYKLNGESMEKVRELTLTLDAESWSLRINKDEWFEEGSRRTETEDVKSVFYTDAIVKKG